MRRLVQLALAAAANIAWTILPALATQVPASTGLAQRVEVHGDMLTLADLLPIGAAAGLSAEAARIALGAAPKATHSRIIPQGEIEFALRHSPDLLERLIIPSSIVVSRARRQLSQDELAAALGLSDVLRQHEGTIPLRLSAPIYVTEDDPGLKVVQVEFDSIREETRFRVRAMNEPGSLPFYVTLAKEFQQTALIAQHNLARGQIVAAGDLKPQQVPPVSPDRLTGLRSLAPVKAGEAVRAGMFTVDNLVTPGQPAELELEGTRFHITMKVIPMQPGALGQNVKVRSVDTKKVILAQVVGRDHLRGTIDDQAPTETGPQAGSSRNDGDEPQQK
jgi:flagella basal body P-ring formation protein FlgA